MGKLKYILTALFVLYIGVSYFGIAKAAEDEKITDEKIVGIALTTYDAQISGSNYAYPLIYYWDLKNFAHAMTVDYQNYKNTVLDFARRHDITPEESSISKEIAVRGQVALEELSKLQGRKLEHKYLDYQLELHLKTIHSIDDVFLPNVQNRELADLIYKIRPVIVGRLDWAKRIKQVYP